MTVRVSPYLRLGGNAREAMDFYRSVFGGMLEISTYADLPVPTDPSQDDLVVHATLTGTTGIVLMGSDGATSEDHRASSIASAAMTRRSSPRTGNGSPRAVPLPCRSPGRRGALSSADASTSSGRTGW